METDKEEWPDYTDQKLTDQAVEMMSYHPAQAEKHHPQRYAALREEFIQLSIFVNGMCPNGRAKSLCLTHLEEALMRATQAIAVGEAD